MPRARNAARVRRLPGDDRVPPSRTWYLILPLLCSCAGDAGAPPQGLRLQPLPVIGGEVDGGPGAFGQVGDIEMDQDGRVYVLDRMAGAVQVYDADGGHVGTIGHGGEGPGELQGPTAIGWGPHGHLWVVDPRNGRYTVFDRQGTLVATRTRSVAGIAGDWPVTFTPRGRLFDVTFELGPGGPSAIPVELDIAGEDVREVREVPLPPLGPWGLTGKEVVRDGLPLLIEIPFSPVQLWQIGPRGDLWHGNTGTYEIRRLSADGVETVYSGDVAASPLTESERDAALEDNRDLEAPMIPTTKPPVRGFFVGEERDLWVLLRSDSPQEDDRIDVFDSLGAHVSTVHVALDPQPRPKVRGGIVVGVARDDLGVEQVVRYRIIR